LDILLIALVNRVGAWGLEKGGVTDRIVRRVSYGAYPPVARLLFNFISFRATSGRYHDPISRPTVSRSQSDEQRKRPRDRGLVRWSLIDPYPYRLHTSRRVVASSRSALAIVGPYRVIGCLVLAPSQSERRETGGQSPSTLVTLNIETKQLLTQLFISNDMKLTLN
jgi:hypothetical protein